MVETRVLIVDDDPSLRRILGDALKMEGYSPLLASTQKEAERFLREEKISLALLDVRLPDGDGLSLLEGWREMKKEFPVIVFTAQGRMETAIRAIQLGAYDYLEKPFDLEELYSIMRTALEEKEPPPVKKSRPQEPAPLIIGNSPAMREVFKLIGRISTSDVTVLITGETGTGKELVARAIHTFSSRKEGPFVAVNTAAIPEELLEAELFGYEKGAFTGAHRDMPGKFREAHGGTIFLDEIGDMPLRLQSKLLRVLQERNVTPLGSQRVIPVDVRVLSASQVDLERAVEEGRFRIDLYHRLNGVRIHLPPLRERSEDIRLLAQHFLDLMMEREEIPRKTLSPDAIERLENYSWPGNVRELENVIRRVALLSHKRILTAAEFSLYGIPFEVKPPSLSQTKPESFSLRIEEELKPWLSRLFHGDDQNAWDLVLGEVEEVLLRLTLELCRGNQVKASRFLGINRNTLRSKLTQYKLDPYKFRRREGG